MSEDRMADEHNDGYDFDALQATIRSKLPDGVSYLLVVANYDTRVVQLGGDMSKEMGGHILKHAFAAEEKNG